MKEFLQRNTVLVTGLAVAALVLAVILGILLLGARELQVETLNRLDQTASEDHLPGPNNRISARSQTQVNTLMRETPHVLGGWVVKLDYPKLEWPVIHLAANEPIITETMMKYKEIQESGKGFSSAELAARTDATAALRNSEEAKSGLIKCGPLGSSSLSSFNPAIVGVVKGVCRATIPPFTDDINLAIIVAIDVDGGGTGPELQAIRRMLLQLQIDIYNRDYQGRETWARSIATN